MTANIANQVSYLRVAREFPADLYQLSVEVNKTYVDIANAVNNRTISLFPTVRAAITGESWFLSNGQKQQTFRQVYSFGAIAPGAELDVLTDLTNFVEFSRIFGTVVTANGTSGLPDWRPLPYVDAVTLTNSITLLVGTFIVAGKKVNKIRIINGTTAPAITKGLVVLEWLVNV